MQFNQATDYAFRVVLYLSSLPPGEIVSAQAIASREQIPMRFLQKIMRSLVKAGLILSHRGVAGGFSLAKAPGEISLLNVVEVMEGPVCINRCFIDEDYCTKNWAGRCPVHQALAGIQSTMIRELGRHNFADLVKPK